MEIKYISVDKITGAEYNPRLISDTQFAALVRSIQEIGFVLPVIVNSRNYTIIAGHQRTRAARAAGMEIVPCFLCDGIIDGDEIKFNQLHNLTDTHDCIADGNVSELGFGQADASAFSINDDNATQLGEICKLITKYGNLLCAVICNGKVLVGARYVKACQLLRQSVNVFNIDTELYDKAAKYLTDDYGVYNYDKLERHTYVQGLAQMCRATEKGNRKRQLRSVLYSDCVLPYLEKNCVASVLDFGCGKGAYITDLGRRGYTAVGVEFYNHNGSKINVALGNAQIDRLIKTIKRGGLFDVVVCDSVLNSVDSMEAEDSVLKCLNVFSKGKVFFSGRPVDALIRRTKLKRQLDNRAILTNMSAFLDENNFTATYRKGHWYYQHYHSQEQIEAAAEKAGLRITALNFSGGSFQAECEKARELTTDEARAAVNFEFTLPLPNGKKYDRAAEVFDALSLKFM